MTGLSMAYISQVRHGKRPPSRKLLEALGQHSGQAAARAKNEREASTAIDAFLASRRQGISPNTIQFYRKNLSKAIPVLGLTPTPQQLNNYFDSLTCSSGGKHAYYRSISVFYGWLYSPRSGYGLSIDRNPTRHIEPPKRPKLILPSLSLEQIRQVIDAAHSVRDKAIVSLFAESGLRLSELLGITTRDIEWPSRIIKVLGKGNKEGFAPFGPVTEDYLRQWMSEYQPESSDSVWDIGFWGIKAMLDELRRETGLPCNPHTFRRSYATILAKRGVDSLHIMRLGRWGSIQMVERYTRSVKFEDSLKLYSPIVT